MVFYAVQDGKTMSIKSCSFAVFIATAVIFYITCRIWKQNLHKTSSARRPSRDFSKPADYNIHNCVTEDVIGTRPRVHLVPCSNVEYRKDPENEESRKSSFKYIFDNRIWGGNKGTPWTAVKLQASGNISFLVTDYSLKLKSLKCLLSLRTTVARLRYNNKISKY